MVAGAAPTVDLAVVVADGTEADIAVRPAMSGTWSIEDGRRVFTPKYPLRPGVRYRVIGESVRLDVIVPPGERGAVPKVVAVHPSATELPENVLRFYLEFDRPMPRGDAYRYVEVMTAEGKTVEWPFLQLDDELWNEDQTRLTLLIDPGRIKREVKPRIDLGPVFQAGRRYTLIVRGQWPTLAGGTLGRDYRRDIAIGPPLTEAMDPGRWRLTPPRDAKQPVELAFDRPLDHALLLRSLTVLDAAGRMVDGKGSALADDRGWSFQPALPWRSGNYVIRIATVLEDVCGNRIGRPFEIDLSRPAPREPAAEFVELRFAVRGP